MINGLKTIIKQLLGIYQIDSMDINSAQLNNPQKSSFVDSVGNAVSGAKKSVGDISSTLLNTLGAIAAGYTSTDKSSPFSQDAWMKMSTDEKIAAASGGLGALVPLGGGSAQIPTVPSVLKSGLPMAGLSAVQNYAEQPKDKKSIAKAFLHPNTALGLVMGSLSPGGEGDIMDAQKLADEAKAKGETPKVLDANGNVAQSEFVGGQSPKPVEPATILDAKGNPIKSTVEAPIKEGGYATPNANPATGTDVRPATASTQPKPNTPPVDTNTTGTLPYPNVPLTPEDVSGTRTGTHPLTGGNPVLVDLRGEAARNHYYLEDQTNSRAVMDKYVPGNTPTEVEYNLPKKLAEEGQRIKNIIGNDPQKINVSDIVAQNDAALKSQGYTPGTSAKADSATRGALNEFDSQVGTHADAPGKEQVSGNDIENYKKILDKQLQSVYKKMDNGTTLTPEETAKLTLRRTLNNNLRQMYPEVGDALDRQSGMHDAIPSAAKAAKVQEATDTNTIVDKKVAAEKLASQPKPNFIQRMKNQPAGLIATELGGTAAVIGGAAIGSQALAGHIANSQNAGDTTTLKPFQLKDPIQSGVVTGEEDKGKQLADLQTKMGEDQKLAQTSMQGDQQYAIDYKAYQALQEKFTKEQPVVDQWKKTLTIQNTINKVLPLANEAPPNPDQFIKWYSDFRSGTDSKYNQLNASLNWMEKNYGADFSKVKSKQALLGTIAGVMQNVQSEQDAVEQIYKGNSSNVTPNNGAQPIIRPQNGLQTSAPAAGTPTKLNFKFGSPGEGLPDIPQTTTKTLGDIKSLLNK